MKKTRNETAVGVFVVVGFILLTLVVFFISGVYVFRQGFQISVFYDYVSILDRGAPVRMAGVRIGEVQRVILMEDAALEKLRVKVQLFIEKGVEIRENYLFTIRGTHVLSEPHIEITPQPGASPLLKDGAVVQGTNPVPLEALISRAHNIAENLDHIMASFRETVQDEENAGALKNILVNLASLTESLEKIFAGSEEDFKNAIRNVETSSASLGEVLEKMKQGEGTMGRLLVDDALYEEMRQFVAEIKAHPWRLMKRDGG